MTPLDRLPDLVSPAEQTIIEKVTKIINFLNQSSLKHSILQKYPDTHRQSSDAFQVIRAISDKNWIHQEEISSLLSRQNTNLSPE